MSHYKKIRGAFFAILATVSAISPVHAQVNWKSQYFTTSDSVKLHYLEAGSGPTIVLVTGWSVPAWIWQHQLRYFAPNYRVIALDPRGQGKSEKPTFGYYASRRARDIWELLEHLDTEPVVLAGWSLGVQEVVVTAKEFGADRIRALVLVDHPVNLKQEVSESIARNRIGNLQLNRPEWTREFMKAIHHAPQPEEYFDSLTSAVLDMPTNAVTLIIANIHYIGPNDLRPMIDEVGKPVLYLYSSNDWAVEAAEEARRNWPEAQIEVIPDTDHALFVDKPQEFNEILEEFITSLAD